MVLGKASFSAIVASAMLATTVQGHGYMSVPEVEFTFVGDTTQYMGTIESGTSGFSGSFGASPTDNTANFNKAFAASKYSSLKEFMTDKLVLTSPEFTKECGYTNPKETAQPVPETYVEWSHGSGEGFTLSHEGPCEVWCDETRVFQDDNCPKNFPSAPAKLPYDRDACLGSSVLSIHWIALHGPQWQVYRNCAALEKTTSTGATSKFAVGGAGAGASTSNSTTPATDSSASEQTTDAPSVKETTTAPSTKQTTTAPSTKQTTTAPSTEQTTDAPSVDQTSTTDAPTVTQAPSTPASYTEAPAAEADTSKCSVRRRRRN